MALLPLALELKKNRPDLDVLVLYIDHQTRPEQSLEKSFVGHWASRFGFTFKSEKLKDWKGLTANFEERARLQRKKWVQNHAGGRVVFTGHHLDDSFEWFLMHSSRSTHLRPRGTPLINGIYRRPWLCVQKRQILRFLHAYALPYKVDPTNREISVHQRNYMRHEIVSRLKREYPSVLRNYVHRQNALALIDRVHVLRGHYAKPMKWQWGSSLVASDWSRRHDPIRVEQLKELIEKEALTTRSELTKELYKVLEALRNGSKGPHKLTKSIHVYIWGKEIFVIKQEELNLYGKADLYLAREFKRSTQIPERLPIKILTSTKESLKAVHPLFPQLCRELKKKQMGWQTPGRAMFIKET